jgi:sucrose-6-phosphatase
VLLIQVGTEIYFEAAGGADKEWSEVLDEGWDRQRVLGAAGSIMELTPQVGGTSSPCFCSVPGDRLLETPG